MQKRLLPLIAAAFIAVIAFSSCSKNNKQGRYIPATAGAVIHIDGASLNEKLPWEEIKKNESLTKMMEDSSITAFQKKMLQDPENSGINIKADFEFFVVKDSAGGYFGFEGSIKDKAKFKEMLSNMHKDMTETTKDDYTYASTSKGSIAYNADKFFIAVNAPMLAYMDKPRYNYSTDTGFGMIEEKVRDMNPVITSLVNLKEDNSLAKDKKFSDLVDTKGDIHFWYNAQYLNTTENLGAAAAMFNIQNLTNGLISTATLNFENGKISMDGKSYGGKDLTDLYKKYEGSDFDRSMVKNIPSDNLAGFFAMNFKPEGIRAFLKMLNADGIVNMGLSKFGISMDDFIKANKGDILFAVTDIPSQNDTMGTKPKFIFSAAIADKASFDKLIAAGKTMGDRASDKMSYSSNDKYFILASDKAMADAFLAGGSKAKTDYLDKVGNSPMGGYVNFQYIFKAIGSPAKEDSVDKAYFDESAKVLDYLVINGGEYTGGGLTQHWELNLMDKSTNSLKQLNAYITKMAQLKMIQDKQNMARWGMNEDMDRVKADTAVTVEVPVSPAMPKH